MKKKIDRAYEKDKYFKKWLVGLSERTKENYRTHFQAWFDFIGMTPTEQIEKRLPSFHGLLDCVFSDRKQGYANSLVKKGATLNITFEGVTWFI